MKGDGFYTWPKYPCEERLTIRCNYFIDTESNDGSRVSTCLLRNMPNKRNKFSSGNDLEVVGGLFFKLRILTDTLISH